MNATNPFTLKFAARMLSCTALAGAPMVAGQAQAQSTGINIPAQSASEAVKQLARTTGTQILFDYNKLRQLRSNPVTGASSAREALRTMLAGSNLEIGDTPSGALTIRANGEAIGVRGEPSVENVSSYRDPGVLAEGEIIVTARKQTERLQDAPVTISAISEKELEDTGATDIKDVLLRIPGVSYANAERGNSQYNIRGVTNGAELPTTGIYVDDIQFVSRSVGGFDLLFFDIDRVEVLKGPQGTLYGGNAMGGAIKYVTSRPNAAKQEYSFALGTSKTIHGGVGYSAEGMFNIPLIPDVLAIRGAAMFEFEPGYVDNVINGLAEDTKYSTTPFPDYTPLLVPSGSVAAKKNYNSGNNYAGRLSLLWTPNASTALRLTAFYQDTDQANPYYFWQNLPKFQSSYRFTNMETHDRLGLYNAEFKQELGPVTLTSLTAYSDRRVNNVRDYSFFLGGLVKTLFDFDSNAVFPTHTKTFSQEVRLASTNPDAPVTFVIGGFLSLQKENWDSNVTILNGQFLGTSDVYVLDSLRKQNDYALFGEVNYRVFDGLTLNAGARLYKNSTRFNLVADGPFAGGPSTRDINIKENGINPRFGASYEVNKQHLLYASAARGFRPGSVLPFKIPPRCALDLKQLGFDEATEAYDSDSVWTYEVGSKNEFLGGRAVVNASAYHTDWKDIQQTVPLPNCGFAFYTNAGTARVRGVEIESRFKLSPAFEVGGNASYIDSEITDPGLGLFKKGDQIQFVPKWILYGYAAYKMPVSRDWNLELRADYSYRSGTRRSADSDQIIFFPTAPGVYDTINGPFGGIPFGSTFQDGYDIVNLRAVVSNGPTSVRIFVNNLFDASPYLDEDFNFGSTRATTLRPRTIGFEIRQKF